MKEFYFIKQDKSFKSGIIIIVLLLWSVNLFCQQVFYNYDTQNKLAWLSGNDRDVEFKTKPNSQLAENDLQQQYNIVMFGNSITANGKWDKGLTRQDVKNSGTGGFTTSHFVWIIKDQVLKYQPKICFLEGGINDIGVGIPLERIYKNYESLVDTLIRHKIIPVLQSTLYVNFPNNEVENNHHNSMVDSLNIFEKNLSESRRIEYLDLNKFLSKNKKLKMEYTTDGVHVNDEAYRIWYSELKEVLKRLGI